MVDVVRLAVIIGERNRDDPQRDVSVPRRREEKSVSLPIPALHLLARFRAAAEAHVHRVAEQPGQCAGDGLRVLLQRFLEIILHLLLDIRAIVTA